MSSSLDTDIEVEVGRRKEEEVALMFCHDHDLKESRINPMIV